MEEQTRVAAPHLRHEVAAVGGVGLQGAPRVLLLDEPALLTGEGKVPHSLYDKLRVLTHDEGMRVVLLSSRADASRALSGIAHVTIAHFIGDVRLGEPFVAILGSHEALPPHAYAWYVGEGNAVPPFHPCRFTGPRGTDEVLGLLGTAEVQERAGFAFRAAGAGEAIPGQVPFDIGILDGIAAGVTISRDQTERLEQREYRTLDLDGETARLIDQALPPILASQAASGAVAAAPPPRTPDDPNYWFFWQRDAGQVVIAMVSLVDRATEPRIRDSVRAFIAKYLGFVEQLPHGDGLAIADLGVSRFKMDGRPVRSYGNPQNDGPAHTVLAVTSALSDDARAYAISKPYLEYLREHIFEPSFDPWEFAVGDIFNDYNLARRALRKGAELAPAQGDDAAAEGYTSTADRIERALDRFYEPHGAYLRAGRHYLQPWIETISGLDSNVIGSILAAYDVEDSYLNLDDARVQRTMQLLETAYADRWAINVAWRATGHAGLGMGRFPEDANDGIGSTGGNPWTFATLWAAEYYLRLVQRRAFLGGEDTGGDTRDELLRKADGYLQFVLNHIPATALTEQIDGQTGQPHGAEKLSWAQAEFIHALLIRRDVRSAEIEGRQH